MPEIPFQRLRNQRGGITPAEGCMFAAVALFVILLLGILYVAFMRFGNPPPARPVPPPPAALLGAFPAEGTGAQRMETHPDPRGFIWGIDTAHG